MLRFNKIKTKLKLWKQNSVKKFKAYIRRLLFPLYLFPIKLLTYSAYYAVKLFIKLLIKSLIIAWHMVSWPFRKWSNFFKTVFWILFGSLNVSMLFVIIFIVGNQYGSLDKFLCFGDTTASSSKLKVVRIIGSYSQGSGFFITPTEVITNFHVINGEASPKVILPDGKIETPVALVGDKQSDLAKITLANSYPQQVMPIANGENSLTVNEQLYSIGFPEGTDIKGEASVAKGQFNGSRSISGYDNSYIQAEISIEKGMSGGPLIEACGEVVGVNQLGLNGQSLFINSIDLNRKIPGMTNKDISMKVLHPEISPMEAVYAYYTYIGARNMQEGYKLLSGEYLQKTNYDEWTKRFNNIISIRIYKTAPIAGNPDAVDVKFVTDNWINNDLETHYYEGVWRTIKEDGVYKMLKSKIVEVENPNLNWYWLD